MTFPRHIPLLFPSPAAPSGLRPSVCPPTPLFWPTAISPLKPGGTAGVSSLPRALSFHLGLTGPACAAFILPLFGVRWTRVPTVPSQPCPAPGLSSWKTEEPARLSLPFYLRWFLFPEHRRFLFSQRGWRWGVRVPRLGLVVAEPGPWALLATRRSPGFPAQLPRSPGRQGLRAVSPAPLFPGELSLAGSLMGV